MVASGIAHRSSGRTQSWKHLSAARTDHGVVTVALNCVCEFCWLKLVDVSECSSETRAAVIFKRQELVRKVQRQAKQVGIFHGYIIHLSELNTIERGVTFLISLYSH